MTWGKILRRKDEKNRHKIGKLTICFEDNRDDRSKSMYSNTIKTAPSSKVP